MPVKLIQIQIPFIRLISIGMAGIKWKGKKREPFHDHDGTANWLWDDGGCILWDDEGVIKL